MGKNRRKKSQNSNWKSYQSDSKSRKKVFLGLGALFFIIIIIIIAKLIALLVGINSPYSPQGKDEKTFYSSSSSRVTVAVKSKNSYLFSVDPVSKQMTIIRLSPEIYLPYSGGVSIKNLDLGIDLSRALRTTFGTYIDGYIVLPDDSPEKFEDFAQNFRKGAGMIYLLQTAKTNMSLVGLIKLNLASRSVREDNFNIIDLSSSNSTRWQVLKDGSRVLQIDQGSLDQSLEGTFKDDRMSMEGLNIAVFNSTTHPGLAEKAAREVTNMGGRVVSTDTIKSPQEKSLVFGEKSYTFDRLSVIYNSGCKEGIFQSGCAKISSELKSADPSFEVGSSKADVVIILGEDYYNQGF